MWPTLHPVGATPVMWPRLLMAALLRRASEQLDRWAHRMVATVDAPAEEPTLEFYAEAGAMEGALYVNGRLVGRLPGVSRL